MTAVNPMNYGLANIKDGELGIDSGIYQQQDAQDAPGIRIYAQVDDAAAYLAKAQELGGTLVQPAMEIPGMGIMVGMFQDPEGNRLGVVQPLQDHG